MILSCLTLRAIALASLLITQPVQSPPKPAQNQADRTARRFGLEKAPARNAGAVRIATYNIENLFDDVDDPSLSGKQEDKDMTKPAADRAAAAAAIRALDADVLALEEVESRDALLWFRDHHLAGLGYDHVASVDAGDERGIEQAVLSRFPIVESINWVGLELGGVHPATWGDKPNDNAGKPITYHRSPLAVTIEIPGQTISSPGGVVRAQGAPYRVTLVVVHHKAGKEGEYWREKEAAKTISLLGDMQKADPERNIVWLGDFNATLADPSMRLITAAGWYDVMGDQQRAALDSNASPQARRNDPAIISHASGRIIDHILLNPGAKLEYIPSSAFVLGTPIKGREGYASDHYPVAIDLTPRDLPPELVPSAGIPK